MMRKILITGVSGFVGSNLAIHLREKYRVFGTFYKNSIEIEGCQTLFMDIRRAGYVSRLLSSIKPNIIIHCASASNIDLCERKMELARDVNLIGTETISRLVGSSGLQLIYVSTDQVYDSPPNVNQTCHEYSLVKPLNIYSTSKLKAESKIKDHCINYIIVRLALPYGLSGGTNWCVTDNIDSALRSKKTFNLYTNLHRSPILIDDACMSIERIIEDSPPNETYNVGGPVSITMDVFGQMYASIFNYDKRLLVPAPFVPSTTLVPRVLNSSLDINKFINRFKYTPLTPDAGIKKLFLQKMMIV